MCWGYFVGVMQSSFVLDSGSGGHCVAELILVGGACCSCGLSIEGLPFSAGTARGSCISYSRCTRGEVGLITSV